MGNPMGMMGKKPVSVTPNSAAELERTTGLEPATLTLAKVMVFVRGDRSARLNRLYSARLVRPVRRVGPSPAHVV
jgi:hypothetical protein